MLRRATAAIRFVKSRLVFGLITSRRFIVRLCSAAGKEAKLASLTSTASQRWDWAGPSRGGRSYEVSLRPSDAGGGGAAGPEWLAEMYVKGEGYVLRGRLSVQGQKLTLTRTEVPNGPFPSGDGEVHNQVRLVMIVAKAKEGASGAIWWRRDGR